MAVRVLVDANVLFSRTIRDWLFLLKLETGGRMFTVATSEDVISEAISKYRDKHPNLPGGVISRMRRNITTNIEELVEDFTVDGSFPCKDLGDAHVHAAAIACRADVLLTFDKGWSGLDEEQLHKLTYEPQHPDTLFTLINDSSPEAVRSVITQQRDYFLAKSMEADLPLRLRNANCPAFALRVGVHLQTLPLPCTADPWAYQVVGTHPQ